MGGNLTSSQPRLEALTLVQMSDEGTAGGVGTIASARAVRLAASLELSGVGPLLEAPSGAFLPMTAEDGGGYGYYGCRI